MRSPSFGTALIEAFGGAIHVFHQVRDGAGRRATGTKKRFGFDPEVFTPRWASRRHSSGSDAERIVQVLGGCFVGGKQAPAGYRHGCYGLGYTNLFRVVNIKTIRVKSAN
jgi:hypothetical protein